MTRRPKNLAPVEGEPEVRAALQGAIEAEGVNQLAKRAKVPASLVSRAARKQAPISNKLAQSVGYGKKVVFYRLDSE